MICFSNSITPRLRYTWAFISQQLTGSEARLTNNPNEFISYQGVKINYSQARIFPEDFWVKPHGLLSEAEIKEQGITCFAWNNTKAFFKTEGVFGFDIFAATFYLLSRYEEYLPCKKDIYGRYAHENSLVYKERVLEKPLINIWLQYFRQALISQFPNSTFPNPTFTFLPTYDIDEAYSFKYKTWQRSAGGAVRDLLSGRFKRFAQRRRVLNHKEADPYDSYTWMNDLHRPYRLDPHYFFLAAEKNGKLDKHNLPAETAVQTFMRTCAEKYAVGVHPSCQSGDDASLIGKERKTIEDIIKIKVTSSRQHFIRFTLPQTYRQLLDAGIKQDFSMGYGSINGFRASVASPFYWYDLEKEETTSLLLHPFCYMEANSYYEQKQTPQQALEEMRHYYTEVKKVNGTLITIWHNTFLGTDERFKGWREVYAQFVKEVMS